MSHPTPKIYYMTFVALLVLLALTVLAGQIDVGRWNLAIAAGIASVKAVLIILYFMQVRYTMPLVILVACAGFFWLGILFVLTFSDYLTRGWTPYSA